MAEWTFKVEVLTTDFALVNRWDPPQFACRSFGIHEVEGNQHLSAKIKLSAPDEAAATVLAEQLVRDYVAGHEVVAQRVLICPPPSAKRGSRLVATRWQRAEVDGAVLDIVWASSEPIERVDIVETATAVTITLYERRYPDIEYVGRCARCVRLRLEASVGGRQLLDGSTGRALGDINVWESYERERREWVLALDRDELECISPTAEVVHRS